MTRRVGLGLRLALLTAARIGEVAGARLTEFEHLDDPARSGWLIPGERIKTSARNLRPHYVSLSPLALATIKDIIELMPPGEELLFQSRDGAPMKSSTFTMAMRRFAGAQSDASPAEFSWQSDAPSPHDLRRTVRTRLSALRIPVEVKDAVLNHVPRTIGEKNYDRHTFVDEKREALDRWSDLIASIINPSPVASLAEARNRRGAS